MTKEEFLKMIETVVEELEEEKKKCSSTIEFYKSVEPNGEDLKKANYQHMIIEKKINAFLHLIGLPAYARIQEMSDVELNQYRNDMIAEIKLKKVNMASKISQLKQELTILKAKYEEIVINFGSLENSKRDSAINEAKEIKNQILSTENEITKAESELAQLEKESNELVNRPLSEIRTNLISKLNNCSSYVRQSYEDSKKELSETIKLQATVGADYQKAQKMASLLSSLAQLHENQGQISTYMHIPYKVPSELSSRMEKAYNYRDSDIYSSADNLIEMLDEFEKEFNQRLEKFNEQFTEEKMIGLINKEYDSLSTDVDFEFLKLHNDKIKPGKLESLKADVLMRDKLSKKLIKTKAVKEEIEELNRRIKREQESIYRTIIGWYRSYQDEILNVRYCSIINLDKYDRLMESLKGLANNIDETKKGLEELRTELEKAKRRLDNQKANHDAQRDKIQSEIRALGGEEFNDSRIPYDSKITAQNLDNIVGAVSTTYRNQVVSSVRQEAQNQANIREAELRGITVDELLQMKNQTSNASDITLSSQSEDELSHGIKK